MQCLKIPGSGFAVSEDAVVRRLLYRIEHRGRSPEIHVRHPHGEDVLRHAMFLLEVVFQGVCPRPVDDLIQVHRVFTSLRMDFWGRYTRGICPP